MTPNEPSASVPSQPSRTQTGTPAPAAACPPPPIASGQDSYSTAAQLDGWSLSQFNEAFPVVNSLGVPARGMLILMIVFALLIGPLNLYFLAKYDRRIWALWTVPLAAVLFSGLVFGYAVVAEGFSGHARHAGVTLLNERTGRATTLGWSAYYMPIAPGDGLRFSKDTEVTPRGYGDSGHGYYDREQDDTALTVDWTDGQHLANGWVQSRVPAFFTTRKVEPRRERLVFAKNDDGQPTVTNGLGAHISGVRVAAADGTLYEAVGLEAGATATLSLSSPGGSLSNSRRQIDHWIKSGQWHALHVLTGLAPPEANSYIAVLADAAPFMDPGTDAANTQAEQVVIGLMETPFQP